ncbi:TlpA family protein disulfide reductase [Streptococcus ratti]|uniref:Thioredoxin family protein n=1 Tax=Streptococcus ratti FA-1 = DSM 20564 TaxID=699248 RepID=A0ABP2QY56_STRRT|nr:TlpA disulfide reductase family protein [Streptococcus ratti]EJN93995.1 putative thioredoxin family protein [Streptococcus ratti FA-1 = DSM 20564]EMP69710.1 thioredoxin [Streptococcus ratti FA-1 = DSM 20564]QEY07830.1 TlpA family protein disulfide reductase [Streptococcus ratti]VEI60300.1 thioredoxin [Streptococcus mutans]
MKKFMLPLALGVSLLGMGLINQTKSSAQGKTSPKLVQTAKKSAPAFKLKNKKDKIVSLSDYKGKKVYINVWATWCDPCMQEIPGLKKVYQAYKGKKNFVFLSVTSPSDLKYQNNNPIDKERSTILAKAKKKGITYPILYDYKDNFVKAYGIRSIPTHIFINSDGSLSQKIAGGLDESSLKYYLNKLK